MMSQNWIRTDREQGLQRIESAGPSGGGWVTARTHTCTRARASNGFSGVHLTDYFCFQHIDDGVTFPLPSHVPSHSPGAPPPIFVLQVFVLLTDVETFENGPTQFIPMSHMSGRPPNDQQEPCFQGKGPISMIGKAGDAYMM